MLDRFSDTIGKIYAAAADGELWGDALAAVEELTGSAGAVIHIVSKKAPLEMRTLLGKSAAGYFLASHVDEWTRDYALMCPRLAAAKRWPDAPYYVDYMLKSERELDFDPVYEWYGSYGLRYFVGSRLIDDDDTEIVWSLQRRREQGHAQQEDIDLFQSIKSHLARALQLAGSLNNLRSFEAVGWSVVESLSHALYALDAAGRLLFANAAARRLLRRKEGIAIIDRRMSVSRPLEQRELDRLIGEAAGAQLHVSSGMCRVSRLAGGPPFAVSVAPLHPFADQCVMGHAAAVAVVVTDPCARQIVDHDLLTKVYGLTDTEARLAEAIAQGHSLDSAAASLGMRVATARTHLKSIFLKLEVNRQQDLVRFLMTLSTLCA